MKDAVVLVGGFPEMISPRAVVSPSARLGRGTVVQAGAHVSADVILGDFVRINAQANLMHDSAVGILPRWPPTPCCSAGCPWAGAAISGARPPCCRTGGLGIGL